MSRTLCFAALAALGAARPTGAGTIVRCPEPTFQLELSGDWEGYPPARKDRDVLYAWKEARPDTPYGNLLIVVWRLHKELEQGPPAGERRDTSGNYEGSTTLTWHGHVLEIVEVRDEGTRRGLVARRVQVPVKGEAIEIAVFGLGPRARDLDDLIRRLVRSVEAETSWDVRAAGTPYIAPAGGRIRRGLIGVLVLTGGLAGFATILQRRVRSRHPVPRRRRACEAAGATGRPCLPLLSAPGAEEVPAARPAPGRIPPPPTRPETGA